MLIVCSSCNSKYLVNSADLKPNGRKVQCSKCNHNWFQTSNIDAEETLESSVPSTQSKTSRNKESQINSNLPSTFIKKQNYSAINSLLITALALGLIFIYLLLKQNGVNFFVLIIYYVQEFYFNLRMIMNDLAKIVFEILN